VTPRNARRGSLLLLVLLAATACRSSDADGGRWLDPAPAPDVAGTSARGHTPVSLRGLRGRVVMLSFGYTHCADVCPVTMQTMQGVLRKLGDGARDVAPVYVTIDPARDTADRIRAFLEPYDDRIDAWVVADASLRGALEAYDVSAARRPVTLRRYVGQDVDPRGDYSLDHTGGVWLIDRSGTLRARYAHGAAANAIAAGVRRLLAGPPPAPGA